METSGVTGPAERPETEVDLTVDATRPQETHNPVRWSAVWAGLLMALALFLLIETVFFSLGWLTFEQGEPGSTAGWITGLIGLAAFLIGGVVAGATSIWTGVREGLIHGALVWALGVVAILFLTLLGGGSFFGATSASFIEFISQQRGAQQGADLSQTVDTARESAGWAVLALVLSLIAATVGGAMGVKPGSRKGTGSTRAS